MSSRYVPLLLALAFPFHLTPTTSGAGSHVSVASAPASGDPILHDSPLAMSIMGALDRVAVDGPCDYYCQDCANPEREWTHAWPNGGYKFSGDPACDPDTECGALGCKETEEQDDEDQLEVEAAFLQLVSMLESASPEVLAAVIEGSNGLITFNESRRSVQVRRCLDRIVANVPVALDTSTELVALTN